MYLEDQGQQDNFSSFHQQDEMYGDLNNGDGKLQKNYHIQINIKYSYKLIKYQLWGLITISN